MYLSQSRIYPSIYAAFVELRSGAKCNFSCRKTFFGKFLLAFGKDLEIGKTIQERSNSAFSRNAFLSLCLRAWS
jgi:hypothetical protein